MLAEAAHSFADTLNQVFLLTALRRSQKPADAQHPFGYGMERYFWSLWPRSGSSSSAPATRSWRACGRSSSPRSSGSLTITYVVLAVSFVFEGVSWFKAVRQLGREADERGRGFFDHLRVTPDPTAKTVAFEDTAALVGIVLAALGIFLHSTTGQGYWDGLASISIGLLLVGVAWSLGQQNKSALIGQALPESTQAELRQIIHESAGIDSVVELMTMRMAPDEVIVAARVDLDDTATVDELEQHADEVERRLREAHPEVRHVFLDPTDEPDEPSAAPGGREAGRV